jgi:hypothetical protein
MSAKKTELEKRAGLKLRNESRQPAAPRGDVGPSPGDRRAQRARDRAAGLVPFAVKLPGDLVAQLQSRARQQPLPFAEWVAQLLRQALRE